MMERAYCYFCRNEMVTESGQVCAKCGGTRLPSIRSDDLFDVLVAIVNTAQTCPDRCMVDVCNDNFLVHRVNLRARLVPGNEDIPVKIEVEVTI